MEQILSNKRLRNNAVMTIFVVSGDRSCLDVVAILPDLIIFT